jgi:hypothetical protein
MLWKAAFISLREKPSVQREAQCCFIRWRNRFVWGLVSWSLLIPSISSSNHSSTQTLSFWLYYFVANIKPIETFHSVISVQSPSCVEDRLPLNLPTTFASMPLIKHLLWRLFVTCHVFYKLFYTACKARLDVDSLFSWIVYLKKWHYILYTFSRNSCIYVTCAT